MVLDGWSISVFSAITPLVLSVVMLIYLRERKVYGGFGHWIVANFSLSMGYTLVSFDGLISVFFSVLIGNTLILYGIVLIYEGIERFYGRNSRSLFNYAVLGTYVFLQIYFTYFAPNTNVRILLSSFAACILLAHAGSRLFLVPIPQLSRTSRGAGYVFLITTLFPLARAISAGLAPSNNLFPNAWDAWFSVVFTASIVVWTFYFFFLNSARLELELETARAELDLIARTDPLTNLYNRRHFDEFAELELQRSKRTGQDNSLMILDTDGFKSINDIYGHDVGDAVLITLANVFRSELRPFDLIARYGGDEFIILLTNTSKDMAYSIAERLRKRIGLTPFVVGSHIFHVTLSAGITDLGADDPDLRTVFKRGDDALYRAKEMGRNCVVVI